MNRGCCASSPSALRSSWMQVTSASSLTTVSRQTVANSSSLDTGCAGALEQGAEHGRGLRRELDLALRGPQPGGIGLEAKAAEAELGHVSTIPAKSRQSPGTPGSEFVTFWHIDDARQVALASSWEVQP